MIDRDYQVYYERRLTGVNVSILHRTICIVRCFSHLTSGTSNIFWQAVHAVSRTMDVLTMSLSICPAAILKGCLTLVTLDVLLKEMVSHL